MGSITFDVVKPSFDFKLSFMINMSAPEFKSVPVIPKTLPSCSRAHPDFSVSAPDKIVALLAWAVVAVCSCNLCFRDC